MNSFVLPFLPELVLLAGSLLLFFVTLGSDDGSRSRRLSLVIAGATLLAAVLALPREATLFSGAYRVDLFSQVIKVVLASGFLAIVLLGANLPDIQPKVRPEYFLFLALSVVGLVMTVSSTDVVALVIALELSSYPLYLLVPMRRERAGQRSQMESAIKYIMFGVAANGLMLFGLSTLFGLTGTTSLPLMIERLQPVAATPLALTGIGLALCGVYYKLAVFPFHFWTPDVYQGAANETAGLVASLPKVAAVVVFIRFVSLGSADNAALATVLAVLAIASMVYGNLIALAQNDFKRLLGFSGIAHAGYAVVGFVALDAAGFAAGLYYISGYMLMVLACFVVIHRVSRDGTNVAVAELAGLHRRSPLLALTLGVGVFGLAGIPPFVGFMGKLSLLTAAYAAGHVLLVVIMMANAAVAVYYYLRVIREAVFGDPPTEQGPIVLDGATRVLCVLLMAAILGMGLAPAAFLDALGRAIAMLP